MKRYVILMVSILVVLTVAWVSFGQPERTEGRRSGRARGQSSRRGMGRERQLKAIAAIEEQLAKVKSGLQSSSGTRQRWQNLSDEERNVLREKSRKMREERQQSIVLIEEQIAKLKGRRRLNAEHEKSIGKLNAIRQLAVKEKAAETTKSIDTLIAEQQKEFEDKLKKLGIQQRRSRPRGTNN